MKFLQINDVHLSDRAPRWRKDSYCDEIFAKLDAVATAAADLQVGAVLCTGDLFHIPAPSRNSHLLVGRTLDWLDSLPCPFIVVPGNHDLSAGRVESLSKQPLGIIARHPKVQLLHGGERLDLGDITIAGVEWRYHDHLDYIRQCITARCDILVTHASVAREPNPFYATINPSELVDLAGLVCFGHLHPPEQVYCSGTATFSNPGALSRGSIAATDLERTPQMAVIEIGKYASPVIDYLPITTAKPASEVFRLEKLEALRRENEAIETFVSELRDTTLEAVSIESLIRSAEELTDNPRILEMLREILNR